MIVTLSRALVVVLLAEVAIVARRSPRHMPLVLWLVLDLLHSLANHFLFRPLFAHTLQPFSGAMRLVLHVAHATFIAPLVAFTLAIFWLIRPAKIFPILAAALGLFTLGMLVVGYGRGPAIGLYQVSGLTFTSERAFVGLAISLDVLLGFVVLPRLGSILQDVRGTDEEAGFVAGIVLELGGILTAIVLARYHDAAFAGAIGLAASAIAVGAYAPVVYLHLLGERSPKFIRRQLVSRRRYALFEMGDRVARSREAMISWVPGTEPSVEEFPTVREVTRRSGRSDEIIRAALVDRTLAVAIELVLSVAWSMGATHAERFLTDAIEMVKTLLDRGVLDLDREFSPVVVSRSDLVANRTGLMAPLFFALFAMLREMETRQAIDALERARSLIARRQVGAP